MQSAGSSNWARIGTAAINALLFLMAGMMLISWLLGAPLLMYMGLTGDFSIIARVVLIGGGSLMLWGLSAICSDIKVMLLKRKIKARP